MFLPLEKVIHERELSIKPEIFRGFSAYRMFDCVDVLAMQLKLELLELMFEK